MVILLDPTPDMLAMPRFGDGAIDMQELLRRLAEQVVNAVMDAEADQLCGCGANSRNGFRERGLASCIGGSRTIFKGALTAEDTLPSSVVVWRALRLRSSILSTVFFSCPAILPYDFPDGFSLDMSASLHRGSWDSGPFGVPTWIRASA